MVKITELLVAGILCGITAIVLTVNSMLVGDLVPIGGIIFIALGALCVLAYHKTGNLK